MKKNTIIAAIAAISAILLCASCQKQELIEKNNGNASGKTFTATIEQGLTKTTITNEYKVNWVEGDQIDINGSIFSATPDASDSTKASLTKVSGSDPIGEYGYTAVYPASIMVETQATLPATQTYAAGKFNAPMCAMSSTETLEFKNFCGVLCFALKGTDKVKSIAVTANEQLCGPFEFADATSISFTEENKGYTVTLDCGEGVQLSSTDSTNFYVYLPPKDSYTAGMKIVVTSTEGKTFEKTTTTAVKIERNNLYTFDWTASFSGSAEPEYVEIAAKYDGSTVSTLRWYRQSLAITDSGRKAWKDDSGSAVKVPGTGEDVVVGDYFQWGTFTGFYGNGAGTDKGLLPYTSFTSTGCGDGSKAFTFKDGKQFNQTNAPYWSGSAYTKYNATDGKTTLEASDDVASIVLGGTWRMPTQAEFQAMKEATYWAWDATDKGYYVYTPNPASDAGKVNDGTGTYDKADALLFFPTAGNGYEDTYYDVESIADYWYGSLNSESIGSACHLFFNSSGGFNADSRDSERFRGFSVRPVQDPAATYVAVTNVSLDVISKNITVGGNLQLNATVIPDDATQQGVHWTSDKPAVATVDPYGKVTGVAAGTATITATTVDGSMTATCTVTVTASVEPEYVEIGGVKWATKNLGATTVAGSGETCYGDYYAWGETAPYYEGTGGWPATLTWKSGKGSGYAWLSYCSSSGFSEWSTPPYDATTKILKPEFDAAAQILGNGWRMPTSAEFKALYDACGGSYDKTTNPSGASASVGKGVYWCTSYDGVAGCLFCDGTNKLFFPAAGYGGGTSLLTAGSYGRYWSSSLSTSGTNYAYNLSFDIESNGPGTKSNSNRYYGRSVRPVKDAAPAPTPTTTGTAKATIGGSQVDVKWIQLWENGPKFAEYNVGVTDGKAEDYGGYYTWGGTYKNGQSITWRDDHDTGSSELSHTGDNITDTATNLWGENWRMPTKAELEALLSNCNVAWTTVGGVNGRKFTGKGAYASNSVFLPAAGNCGNGDVGSQGSKGFYRSSTPSDSNKAYSLYFTSSSQQVTGYSRSNGYSVRAVLAEQD